MSDWDNDYWDDDYFDRCVRDEPVSRNSRGINSNPLCTWKRSKMEVGNIRKNLRERRIGILFFLVVGLGWMFIWIPVGILLLLLALYLVIMK